VEVPNGPAQAHHPRLGGTPAGGDLKAMKPHQEQNF
jgi:hypothetical protein